MRLDAYLVDHGLMPTRGAAQRAIEQGRVTVDGRTRSKSHKVAPGEDVQVAPGARGAPRGRARGQLRRRPRGRRPAGGGQARGRGGAPGRGQRARHAGPGPGRTGRRRSGPRAAGDRAPPGPRHLRAAGGGQDRGRARRAVADDPRARGHPALPGAGRRPAAGRLGHHRRAAGPRPAPAHRDVLGHRQAARGDHPLRAPGGAAADDAAGRGAADRAHAPDPRAHAGDRPSGVRRPPLRGLRGGPPAGPSSASSCTRTCSCFGTRSRREEVRCESKPPADLRRALDAARREPVSGGPDGH